MEGESSRTPIRSRSDIGANMSQRIVDILGLTIDFDLIKTRLQGTESGFMEVDTNLLEELEYIAYHCFEQWTLAVDAYMANEDAYGGYGKPNRKIPNNDVCDIPHERMNDLLTAPIIPVPVPRREEPIQEGKTDDEK